MFLYRLRATFATTGSNLALRWSSAVGLAALWLFNSRRQALILLAYCMVPLCRLTFEVRRDQRQDARPGPVKMYAYHRPGPGGLPLGLASTEGLGLTGAEQNIVDL